MNKATVSQDDSHIASDATRGETGSMQISLGVLMLLMVVFAIMSAGLMYASRVDIVQDELNVLFGKQIVPSDGTPSGRVPHLVFILFTLTSPLLLAGLLSTAVGVYRLMGRRQ